MNELLIAQNRIHLWKHEDVLTVIARGFETDSTQIIAALVGTFVIYVLEFVWHMMLPFHVNTLKSFGESSSVLDKISEDASDDGMYFAPNFHHQIKAAEGDEKKELMLKQQESMSNGPVVFLSYKSTGTGGFGTSLGIQFICDFITMIIAAYLVTQLGGDEFGSQITIVMLVALSGIVTNMVPLWNWFVFSSAYLKVHAISVLINWAIAGTVLIKML